MRLIRYSIRRVLLLLPVLLAAMFITFLLTRIVPGNPIDRVAGPYISQERRDEMKRAARLDRPFYVQFALYLGDLLRGDMGTSYTTAQAVTQDLREKLPATFELVVFGMLIAVGLGLPIGIIGALTRDSWPDQVGRVISVIGVSVPIFWLALMLLYLFYYQWNIAPAATGRLPIAMSFPDDKIVTGMYSIDALLAGDLEVLRAALAAMVLPAVATGLTAMAPITRMARSSMINALESDYVRTARTLGLPGWRVVLQHAFKNALPPILTIMAAVFGFAVGGEVLVEYIFAWPGLGLYAYNAILAGDFPAIQGFILLVTTAYVLIYLVVDLLNAVIDPRVQL